jgi:hypothetical protein
MTVFSSSNFQQHSGLAKMINRISDPGSIARKERHIQDLFRYNRIPEALGLVLCTWTPIPMESVTVEFEGQHLVCVLLITILHVTNLSPTA